MLSEEGQERHKVRKSKLFRDFSARLSTQPQTAPFQMRTELGFPFLKLKGLALEGWG